jgi:TRAP-type C4-dicarboxylate transport system substrate-binding protein
MESQGLVGLAFYDSGARSFYTVKKPIKSLADMKGSRSACSSRTSSSRWIEALGANPTPMPYGEVYTALKTGIVDAAENNWPSYESSRHFEAAKYYSQSRAFARARGAGVLQEGLGHAARRRTRPPIRKAAKESVPYMRKLWDEREVKSRKIVEAAGTQVVPIANKQEFIDAMKPVYAKFANTPRLQELVKRIQETK